MSFISKEWVGGGEGHHKLQRNTPDVPRQVIQGRLCSNQGYIHIGKYGLLSSPHLEYLV